MQPATHLWATKGGAAAKAVSQEEEERLLLEKSINDTLAHSDFLDSTLKDYLTRKWGFPANFNKETFCVFFRDDAFKADLRRHFEKTEQAYKGVDLGEESRLPGYRGAWTVVTEKALERALVAHVGQERWDQATDGQKTSVYLAFRLAIDPFTEPLFSASTL